MERKMATIRVISDIQPIPGADAIEVAAVDGWKVVVKKGEYEVGQSVIYCEIDSWIPHDIAPFLSKGKEPREYNGIQGERLRTVKLRGQISQGLILPLVCELAQFSGGCHWFVNSESEENYIGSGFEFCEEGDDLSEILNIQKWEKPAEFVAANAKGNFPHFIPKTDQERIQNLKRQFDDYKQEDWEVTEKLDGSSMTVFVFNEQQGVCSRNLELKEDETNTFWKATKNQLLIEKIRNSGKNLAVQGELIGEGIQGNSYSLTGQKFYCFDIFDIDEQKYLLPDQRRLFCLELDIPHVPLYSQKTNLKDSIDAVLEMSDGPSEINPKAKREGFVYKHLFSHDVSFKAISNKWILKNE